MVGLGMLLVLLITVSALNNITSVFSITTDGVGLIAGEVQRMWKIEKEISNMSMYMHDFIASGSGAYRTRFRDSQTKAQLMLNELGSMESGRKDMPLLASVMEDFSDLGKKSERIFYLGDPAGADRTRAFNLIIEMDGLIEWLGRDISKYKEASADRLNEIVDQLQDVRIRINIMFAVILATAVMFLAGFGLYLYRKVSMPLGDLWAGTEAISKGNLDYKIKTLGQGDISRLAERFNDMAEKLKRSYADMERRLLDRTQEISALSSVALALVRTGSLKEVLQSSLDRILGSVAGMEPRGGMFLMDQDGQHLRLAVHKGMSEEFARQEEIIRVGECLCGIVARTGEIIYTDSGCEDPRHTRNAFADRHSHIIAPIKSRGRIFGVLFLYPEKSFKLNPSDIQMFDTIGSQLGIAVENFRLYGEVKSSSEKYWDLFENSRDILFTMDEKGTLTAVNDFTVKFSGYGKSELLGRNIAEFLTEDGKRVVERMFAADRTAPGQFVELEVVKKDGGRAVVEFGIRRMIRRGAPPGFQVSGRDMTEHRRLQGMFVKAERLAAIAQVGIAVRHEINNPLTTVIGNTELLLDRYEDAQKDLKERLTTVLNNALRISEIVKRLEGVKDDKLVEYLDGVRMTDLKSGS